MKKSKPYSALPVNRVSLEVLIRGRVGQDVVVGFDIGKFEILTVPRQGQQRLQPPLAREQPRADPRSGASAGAVGPRSAALRAGAGAVGHLRRCLASGLPRRGLVRMACQPQGGPRLRRDLRRHAVAARWQGRGGGGRAGGGTGKATAWPYTVKPVWEQELVYWVDWLDAQRQLLVLWSGRLEGLLARHWPEATRVLKVTKATLLHALIHYGGPAALAADGQADQRLARWGGSCLSADKRRRLLQAAQSSVGIRQGAVEQQRLREYATEALEGAAADAAQSARAGQAGARPAGAASAGAGSGQRHGVCVVGQRWRPARV